MILRKSRFSGNEEDFPRIILNLGDSFQMFRESAIWVSVAVMVEVEVTNICSEVGCCGNLHLDMGSFRHAREISARNIFFSNSQSFHVKTNS